MDEDTDFDIDCDKDEQSSDTNVDMIINDDVLVGRLTTTTDGMTIQ